MKIRILFSLQIISLFTALACCAGPKPATHVKGDDNTIVISNRYFSNQNLLELSRKENGNPAIRLEFQHCTFQGQLSVNSAPNAYQAFPVGIFFRECTFEAEVNFQAIQFSGQVDFSKCQFKKGIVARNAVFAAPVGFRECGFDGEASFQNCIFMKECTWIGSYFYSFILFQGTRFMEKAQFQNARFMANADFTQCRFEEGGIFDYCVATGKLDFSESKQEGKMTFRKAVLQKGLYLNRFRSFAPIQLIDTQFEDSLYKKEFRWFAEPPEVQGVSGKAAPTAGF
jgi:uncharacterized protein YjbI with pentapeptide repeats